MTLRAMRINSVTYLLLSYCLMTTQAKECVNQGISNTSIIHLVQPLEKIRLNLKPPLDASMSWTPVTFTLGTLATITLTNHTKILSGITLVNLKIALLRSNNHKELSLAIPLAASQWNKFFIYKDDDKNLILQVTTKYNHITYETKYEVCHLRESMMIQEVSSSCEVHCFLEWEVDCLNDSDQALISKISMTEKSKKSPSINKNNRNLGVTIVTTILLFVLVAGVVLFLSWRYQKYRLKKSIKDKKLTNTQDIPQERITVREQQPQRNGESLIGYDGPYTQLHNFGTV